MLIVPMALGGGLVAGYAGGGRLRALWALRLRALPLVGAAVAAQLALPAAPAGLRYPVLAGSYALVGAWLWANLTRRAAMVRLALGLLAAGWLLNLAPIAANGTMPVSQRALERVNEPLAERLASGELAKHTVAGPGTRLATLGDVIPVAPMRTVVSLGDVVMGVGILLTVAAGMASARTTGAHPVTREEVP